MELKTRREMNPDFQWNLTDIFASEAAWQAAYAKAEAGIPAFTALQGSISTSAESLKSALDSYYGLMQEVFLVYVYALLNKSGDNGDPAAQAMEERATRLYVAVGTAASFLTPEILATPKEKLGAYRADPQLSGYAHILEEIERGRAHTLDAERERMLAMLADAAHTPDNSFTMLESVDMRFPAMLDENDEEITITHGNYTVLRESPDPRVRREAFEKYFGEFNKYINTFAATYAGSVKFDTYFSEVRGYPSACEAALFGSNVPLAVYDALVEAVHANLGAMRQYLTLRKKVLGLEELHMYDLYNPIVADVEFPMNFDAGKKLVKEALQPLGAEYGALLDRAFEERWMDVYENKGKTTGAFSCGVHGVHPFVLLNYTDTLDDAFTLAHELGHAMHSYRSSEVQDFANHEYMTLVAEVASTVNEVLLLKHLLKTETDENRRAYLLNHFVEGFRTTIFRQTLFAEFERRAHEMQQAGEPLTAETLNALYRELNELYYEGAMIDTLQDIEWARIPHFYNAFYVYQYATGYASAVAIASRILETGDPSSYLEFLSTGGSDYPLNELKIAGVDLTDPGTVSRALDIFGETVEALTKLLTEE